MSDLNDEIEPFPPICPACGQRMVHNILHEEGKTIHRIQCQFYMDNDPDFNGCVSIAAAEGMRHENYREAIRLLQEKVQHERSA